MTRGETSTTLPLSNAPDFAQNPGMTQPSENDRSFRGLVQWAITPPQSYAVYLIALFLVAGLSFYAGSLRPNKKSLVPPQSTAQPAPPQR
jgi:hypothetical protein